MNTNKQPITKTYKELFLEYSFYIPKYQRGYSWGKNHVDTFINDLQENDKGYFVGNIMVSDHKNGILELIDGQQRTITAYLILCAINNIDPSIIENKKTIIKNNKSIIICNDRVQDSKIMIFDYISKNVPIINDIKESNEIINYEYIYKKFLDYPKPKLELIYNNLMWSKIVFISDYYSKSTPYQIFLNVNTKGLKLTSIEILKSKIFYYLAEDSKFDYYKNQWYKMENLIGQKNHQDYVSMFLTLYNSKIELLKKGKKVYRKIPESELINKIIELVNSKDKALEILNFLCDEKKGLLPVYEAVVNSNINNYVNNFKRQINLKLLFDYSNFLKANKFTQFNISLISILLFENEDDKKIIYENYSYILSFIKIIYLYMSLKSISNESPSSYANKFIELSIDCYLCKKNIKENIKKIISIFSFSQLSINDALIKNIDKMKCEGSKKEVKLAKSLITFLDGSESTCNYAEHFYNQSSNNDDKFMFGNIIPVNVDPYGNIEPNKKIIEYRKISMTEKHIEIFLKHYDSGKSINDRTMFYKNELAKRWNELLALLKEE